MKRIFNLLKSVPILKEIHDISRIYSRKNGTVLAKGIAYSFLIASIPLLFIALYISLLVFSDASEMQDMLLNRLSEIIPMQLAELIIKQVSEIALNKSWLKIGIIGFAGLFLVPRTLFASLENSLITVMDSPKRRNLIKRQLLYLILIIFAVTLFFTASYIHLIIKTILNFITLPFPIVVLGSKTLSTLLICFALIVIYRVCYHSSIKRVALVTVSLSIAFIWQVINFLGASIITISGKKEVVYGLLAGGVIFLFWAYIFAVLLLMGGIIIARQSRKHVKSQSSSS